MNLCFISRIKGILWREILMKNQENVFVMNVNGDMFLLLEGLAYSRRYQNMRYLIQAYWTTYSNSMDGVAEKPFTAILCIASDMNEYVIENPDCYENILWDYEEKSVNNNLLW